VRTGDYYELIIFDCDGVLVDSEVLAVEVESTLLGEVGISLSPTELAEQYVGLSYTSMIRDLEARFERWLPPRLREDIETQTMQTFRDRLQAVEGAAAFLDGLAHPRCVASSSDLDRINLTLRLTGIAKHFDATKIYSAQMVENGKPDPDLFLLAASRSRVAPERCLVIEDSAYGVTAAVRAGMDVAGLLAGGHATPSLGQRLSDAGATSIFPSYAELASAL
jgi:HAD superfamily hydrolase (TIGR01509 family)